MHSILRLSQFAPPADRARMRAMLKAWAQADTSRNFAREAPLPPVRPGSSKRGFQKI
jgi:hypothetical protein